MFDWGREVVTCDPEYYRWNSVVVPAVLQARAWRTARWRRWTGARSDQTVLAREQVVGDDACERCGTPVDKRDLEQWFFRITEYADELLDFSEHRLAGARQDRCSATGSAAPRAPRSTSRVEARRADRDPSSPRGPTRSSARPSWCWRPSIRWSRADDAPSSERRSTPTSAQARRADRDRAPVDRAREDRRASPARTRINPVNDERIPIWIADYVLMGYGTGAIMAVPAHDQRDFEFAREVRPADPCVVIARRRRAGPTGRGDRRRLHRRRGAWSIGPSSTACRPTEGDRRAIIAASWRERGAGQPRSTTACATG